MKTPSVTSRDGDPACEDRLRLPFCVLSNCNATTTTEPVTRGVYREYKGTTTRRSEDTADGNVITIGSAGAGPESQRPPLNLLKLDHQGSRKAEKTDHGMTGTGTGR
jgi:hypothetical protein